MDVSAEAFDRFHRAVRDAQLDSYARIAGFPSGIGRLSLVDDETLESICRLVGLRSHMRVLDLCCGRGFLARWLAWRGIAVEYLGIDRSPVAVAAARLAAPRARFVAADIRDAVDVDFDVVFALEAVCGLELDDALADAIVRPCARHGTAVVTLASLTGPMQTERGIERLRRRSSSVAVLDGTSAVRGSAAAMYVAYASDPDWDVSVSASVYREAMTVLRAMTAGRFSYTVVIVRR